MNDLRSHFGRVRGLGSATSGTRDFWIQRLTAAANVPLALMPMRPGRPRRSRASIVRTSAISSSIFIGCFPSKDADPILQASSFRR
jgi:hypothetical protein